jgi:hypothetical protein
MQTTGRTSYQLYESVPLAIAEVPECKPQLQPSQQLKLHSCTTYTAVGVDPGGLPGC